MSEAEAIFWMDVVMFIVAYLFYLEGNKIRVELAEIAACRVVFNRRMRRFKRAIDMPWIWDAFNVGSQAEYQKNKTP